MKFLVKTKLSENISVTPEGFLLCKNVPLTHTGALRYMPGEHPFGDDVGEIIIRRSPEELFSPATLASFEGKDITIQHPKEFVSPENYRELTHGVLVNLRKGEEKIEVEGELVEVLLGDILVKSAEAIETIQAGEREVSLGYDAEWELKDGEVEGTHSKIRGNHCAIVSSGRAGINCAILDSKKENHMTKELADKFRKMFGKTVDEAVKEKEDEEEKKAKDEAEAAEKAKKEKETSDAEKMDKLCADVAKLSEVVNALAEKVNGKEEKSEDESEEEKSEDDDVIVEEDEGGDEADEGMEGEDSDDEEESDKKEKKAGDTASRAEILAPGIDTKGKEVMKNALTIAYKTADGKKMIDKLTDGKDPSTLPKEAIKPVFNAAAEMMKAKRAKDLAATKVVTIDSFPALAGKGSKTAEEINKLNAEFYHGKKK